jgi:transposase InsO family protein
VSDPPPGPAGLLAPALVAEGVIKNAEKWVPLKLGLDTHAEANLISPIIAEELGLKRLEGARAIPIQGVHADLPAIPSEGCWTGRIGMTDEVGERREEELLFIGARLSQACPVLLGVPGLQAMRLIINCPLRTWRFERLSVQLVSSSEFLREAEAHPAHVYAVHVADLLAQPAQAAEAGSGRCLCNSVGVCAVAVAGAVAAPLKKEPAEVPECLRAYEDVFSLDKAAELAPLRGADDHAIETTGDVPPGRLYQMSAKELAVLREYLDKALVHGHIRHSVSPAGAPVLFVPKKDGSLRLCVDYRGLNKVTRKNRLALPLISEVLDQLSGARLFTKLDLKDAYHRIRVREGDEWKTAFRTKYGHFEYVVMPFGLANAPATFQAYINKALHGLVDQICVVYLDDIMIYSRTEEEHAEHVRLVLERLRGHQLYANPAKCDFFTDRVDFLGFVVDATGTHMDPERVKAIAEWPIPQSYRDIQVFLGFANFYRRFIEGYSEIASPITALLKGMVAGKKKGPWEWPQSAQEALDKLKKAFTTTPFLVHYDPDKPTRLETDASGYALGAILSQLHDYRWRPVAFWSRKMNSAEVNYHTYDQELLAIMEALKHWRHYVEGAASTVKIVTDHKNLVGFGTMRQLNARQKRWALELAAADVELEYRTGKTNPADGPSRRPDYRSAKDERDADQSLLPTLLNKLKLGEDGWRPSHEIVRIAVARARDAAQMDAPSNNAGKNGERYGLRQAQPESRIEIERSRYDRGESRAWAPGDSGGDGTKGRAPEPDRSACAGNLLDTSSTLPGANNTFTHHRRATGGGPFGTQFFGNSDSDLRTDGLATQTSTDLTDVPTCNVLECAAKGKDSMVSEVVEDPHSWELGGRTQGRMEPTAGQPDCKQVVPRLVARAAMTGSTAFNNPQDALVDLIRSVQQTLSADVRDQLKRAPTEGRRWKPGAGMGLEEDTQGVLRYHGRVWVPHDAALQREIVVRHHDAPLAGHFGLAKTLELIRRNFWWNTMAGDVQDYVATCDTCQRSKAPRHKPYGQLQPLPPASAPWEEITMDFVTGLPPSRSGGQVHDAILVICCRFTRAALYLPCQTTIDSERFIELFTDRVIGLVGAPKGIVTDRGSVFTSEVFRDFCFELRVKQKLSTAFHPQTDGRTERQNQTMEQYLRSFCATRPQDWAKWLALAQLAHNNAYREELKASPLRVWTGVDARVVCVDARDQEQPPASERAAWLNAQNKQLEELWKEVAERQARYYNRKHAEKSFEVGDLVLLSTKDYNLKVSCRKLAPKFDGPYRICARVGEQAYRLQLPTASRRHNVFNVSKLELYQLPRESRLRMTGPEDGPTPPIVEPVTADETGESWEIETILSERKRRGQKEYLVRWKGFTEAYDQWVAEQDVQAPELIADWGKQPGERHKRKRARR